MTNIKVWIKVAVLLLMQIEMIVMEPHWYRASDDTRYLIETKEKFNWFQAWIECSRYDAELLAIENDEQNRVVTKLLNGLYEKNMNLWIGGHVIYNKTSYRWATNEQNFTFTNWFSEEPDKSATRIECVYIMRQRKDMPWITSNCDAQEFGYICKEITTKEGLDQLKNRKENVEKCIMEVFVD